VYGFILVEERFVQNRENSVPPLALGSSALQIYIEFIGQCGKRRDFARELL
jgi:hypothetical protein